MKQQQIQNIDVFSHFRDSILNIDPVSFIEANLTLDGKKFRINGNGYKPFADIYRYIGLKAVEPNALPIVLVKGRQVGATTMASALECYFAACGLYGNKGRAPMRIMHLFPTLGLAAAYSKTKLDPMISAARPLPNVLRSNGMPKSFIEALIDTSHPGNDNLTFKRFSGDNQLMIESSGPDGDRIRGRQLALDTELPTPNGFIKLSDLREGDQLFDENGVVCNVTKMHPINYSPEAYKITFDDGTVVEACAEHLWLTHTKRNRRLKTKPTIKNTKEILDTLKACGESNHSIPLCSPVKYSKKILPIDPYLLGFWLGDGDRWGRIETADPEVLASYEHRLVKSSVGHLSNFSTEPSKSSGYRVVGLTTALTKLGLVRNPGKTKRNSGDSGHYHKYIPVDYMHGSIEQRFALLQGLMDSDGSCSKDGRCEFVQAECRKELAFQVLELIQSLGIKATILKAESHRYEKQYQDRYRVQFWTTQSVFRLQRKLINIKEKLTKSKNRYIKTIEPISSKPMRCITVDSPSHLYLITKAFIPTHNTVDSIFFDECFPYEQKIETENGKISIGKLYAMFSAGNSLPLVKTYNEVTGDFEYKKITNAWNRGKRTIVELVCGNRAIKCTPNHRFLTSRGWLQVNELQSGDLIKTTPAVIGQLSRALNDDQLQIVLGSFLGDGNISKHGGNKYRIREIHGMQQSDYCIWKASMFGATVSSIAENGYSRKPAIKFASKLFAITDEFPTTKTTCPQWVLDKLDARGLAIWFMDDGSVSNSNAVFHTCSFDEDSQIRIVAKLKSMGVDCEYRFYPVKGKRVAGYYSIYLNKKNYLQLCEIIKPYIHSDLFYKVNGCDKFSKYNWNNKFLSHGLIVVDTVLPVEEKKFVYDIEVEDNHNFIVTSGRKSEHLGGLIAHNCQDTPSLALGAATKILSKAQYGAVGQGIQVYFGTPKQKGTTPYYNMWRSSSQQYYHLRCEKCDDLFPLYRPDVNWEEIWLYAFIVKCTKCGHEQDKNQAAERGKWVPLHTGPDVKMVGYHFNQLYIPNFPKELIIGQKPENNPINTERIYQNEVLGEFYDGEASTLSPEEIHDRCADKRSFAKILTPGKGPRAYAGFDWGQRGALDQLFGRQRGQSYSCAVVITVPQIQYIQIEFATRLMRNDPGSKQEIVEEMFRRYGVHLAIGDIGDAFDLTHILQKKFPDRFLASRANQKVVGHVRYLNDIFPKEIQFERDYYISELIGLIKSGNVRFPYGSYEEIMWLVNHCCSMDVKVTMNKSGDPQRRFIKGPTPNDGFMALLNAYLAYKFDITQGFNIKQPQGMQFEVSKKKHKIPAVTGYMTRFK